MAALLGDFLRFIRVALCLAAVSISLTGFLLFNSPSQSLVWIAGSVFFLTACSYMVNHITDKSEDEVNNHEVNRFAKSRAGYAMIAVSATIGICLASGLGNAAFLLYAGVMASSFTYSLARVKRVPIVKNLWTGIVISMVFLIGVLSGGHFHESSLAYTAFFAFAFAFNNLAGDMRGFEGDLAVGLRTIPTMIGFGRSRAVTQSVFVSLTAMASFMFPVLVPMFLLSLAFMARGSLRKSRLMFLGSFLLLPAYLIMRGGF